MPSNTSYITIYFFLHRITNATKIARTTRGTTIPTAIAVAWLPEVDLLESLCTLSLLQSGQEPVVIGKFITSKTLFKSKVQKSE